MKAWASAIGQIAGLPYPTNGITQGAGVLSITHSEGYRSDLDSHYYLNDNSPYCVTTSVVHDFAIVTPTAAAYPWVSYGGCNDGAGDAVYLSVYAGGGTASILAGFTIAYF